MTKKEYTFENYDVTIYNRYAYTSAAEFIKGEYVHQGFGIYGMVGTGKTSLLYAMRNEMVKAYPQEASICIRGSELAVELKAAAESRDFLIWHLKKKYKAYQVIFIDEIQIVFDGGTCQKYYSRLFHYLMRKKVKIVFTQDCSEELFCALSKINDFCRDEGQVMMVGITKPGQNRGLEPIKIVEC